MDAKPGLDFIDYFNDVYRLFGCAQLDLCSSGSPTSVSAWVAMAQPKVLGATDAHLACNVTVKVYLQVLSSGKLKVRF